jgi:hypothetical protein
MSAIQTLFRALFRSGGNAREKYSYDRNLGEPEPFERRRELFSGRGIICYGAGFPPSTNSGKSRTFIER